MTATVLWLPSEGEKRKKKTKKNLFRELSDRERLRKSYVHIPE